MAYLHRLFLLTAVSTLAAVAPTAAADFRFSTGAPDGRIATASGPAPGAANETETADDFVLGKRTRLNGGSFTGLLPTGLSLADATNVEIEFYRVFPGDSTVPPSGRVPTRDNSPADNDFASRDSSLGELGFTAALLNGSFAAANSVVSGINPAPGQFTGGEGAVTGQEVRFDFNFVQPLTVDAGHYFFRPEVELSDGKFLWLSAAKPIGGDGTPFAPDLQSWIRNGNIAPDWLRVGTDITHQGPFNAAFDLSGSTVPEPATWAMLIGGFGAVGTAMRRRRPDIVAA